MRWKAMRSEDEKKTVEAKATEVAGEVGEYLTTAPAWAMTAKPTLAVHGTGGKWRIVEAPEIEQGVEGRNGKTIAKNQKPVSEDTGKTRVKKSA